MPSAGNVFRLYIVAAFILSLARVLGAASDLSDVAFPGRRSFSEGDSEGGRKDLSAEQINSAAELMY